MHTLYSLGDTVLEEAIDIYRGLLELVYIGLPKPVPTATEPVNKEVWKKPEA
jgi:hypothetical protein